ncbi:MAG TPA: hypothetical protein DDW86_04180 [Clostridiales bacterium]|jgi:hypothetical protein|nr:hypothetical protein [Clostridiales bacterium]
MPMNEDLERFNQYPYSKLLDQQKRELVFAEAKNIGENNASRIYNEFGSRDPFYIAHQEQVSITFDVHDDVNADYVKFAEYHAKKKNIVLNEKSIEIIAKSYDKGVVENLILTHELFHHFEVSRWGLTSKKFKVPVVYFGLFRIGRPVLAASEIAADAFAQTLNNTAISAANLENAYFSNID